MKRALLILVIVGQLAVLIGMAVQRECVARYGRAFFLRTAPVDPSDYMRGEYSRLNYEISNVPAKYFRDGVKSWANSPIDAKQRDARVYAVLSIDQNNEGHLVALTDREPDAGVYLRGRVESVSQDSINVRYGIEALFMQEGSAAKIDEERRGKYQGVPLDADVAVSAHGLGVLTSVHWEKVGITLTLQRTPAATNPKSNEPRALAGATVQFKNVGTTPVTMVLRPKGRSFRLLNASQANDERYPWVNGDEQLPPISPADLKTLAPGQTVEQSIDFDDDFWSIEMRDDSGNKTPTHRGHLRDLQGKWSHAYRLEYAPAAEKPDAAPNVFRSHLTTPVFYPGGSN